MLHPHLFSQGTHRTTPKQQLANNATKQEAQLQYQVRSWHTCPSMSLVYAQPLAVTPNPTSDVQ